MWICITLSAWKAHCSNEISPFWVESPLNMVTFGILPTNWEATLGQKISHCCSWIGLCNCMFVPSLTFLLSPSGIIVHPSTSAWVLQWHIQYLTVTQLHLNGSQFITYFPLSSLSRKTYKAFFSSSFCITMGSKVVHSLTSPTMISVFVNAGDNAWPLSNSVVKINALWLLSLIGIRGTLTVDVFDILKISEFQLIKTVSDIHYNYFSQYYS